MPPTVNISFDVSLNIYALMGIIVLAALVGFIGRSRQLARKDRRINELEREMMQAHAELLDTQRDYCELELKVKDVTSPVIAMKNSKKEAPPEKPARNRSGLRNDRATGTD